MLISVAPMDPRFDDDRVTAIGMLFEAQAALVRQLEPTLDAHGLAHGWFEVLLRLARTPEHRLRMSELAASMTSITPSGLTRLIDRMTEAGLVERASCPEDRRGSYAVLTAEGLRRFGEVYPQHVTDIDSAYTSVLTSRELETVTRALRKVRDASRAD